MKTVNLFALGLVIANPCFAETISLAVNIGPKQEKESGNEVTVASIKDFQAADKNINENTKVERIIAPSGALWYALELLSAENNRGGMHEIDLDGQEMVSAYTANDRSWNDVSPIVDSYIFAKDDKVRTLTIHGIKDARGTITLTVWAIGDNVGQENLITPSYAGKTLEGKMTDFGAHQKRKTNASPYVQFTFPSDEKTDSISFEWSNPKGLTCLSGFSLSYVEKK